MVILNCICAVMLIISSIAMSVFCIKYHKSKDALESLMAEHEELLEQLPEKAIEYSTKTLDYVRMFCAQVTVLLFNEFMDGHDTAKLTDSIVKNLIRDIAIKIQSSIVSENIDFDNTLFDRKFMEQYIVQNVVANVKELLNRKTDESAE